MEPQEYEKMYQLEDTHWWFAGKRRLVEGFLKKLKISNLLDIGCGTGANLRLFSRYGKAIGVDLSPLSIKFSSLRGCPYLVRASINNLPFKNNIFDVITLLDVLYHRMVDEDALTGVYRIMRQGGMVVITDSALEFLRSPHDIAVHGARRYNKRRLMELVQGCGFSIERLTYTNSLLFPLVCLIRLWKRYSLGERSSSDLKPVNPLLNYILLLIQGIERFLLRFINLPIGSSILCIARKSH